MNGECARGLDAFRCSRIWEHGYLIRTSWKRCSRAGRMRPCCQGEASSISSDCHLRLDGEMFGFGNEDEFGVAELSHLRQVETGQFRLRRDAMTDQDIEHPV